MSKIDKIQGNPKTYLKFHEFWNIETNCKYNHTNNVISRMASSYMNPKWPADSKVSLKTHGKGGKDRSHFCNMCHGIDCGKTIGVIVLHIFTHEFDLGT